MSNNFLLKSDQYKCNGHARMLPGYVQSVDAYLEARAGAKHNVLTWFGLTSILKKDFVGEVITKEKIAKAKRIFGLSNFHKDHFNEDSWVRMLEKHKGKLPLSICAAPEGSRIPIGNALMTVKGTDDEFPWLSQRCESRLMHVWYPTTIATKSRVTLDIIKKYLALTSEAHEDLARHLFIDFGYRGTTCDEQAAIGSSAHMVNCYGSDTVVGLEEIDEYYGGLGTEVGKYAYGVPASEHSISQTYGRAGEHQYLIDMLEMFPDWLVSIVGDTYNIENFVDCHVRNCKQIIIDRYENRQGDLCKVIIRPDSLRGPDDTPLKQIAWIYEKLADIFGFTINKKGFKTLYPGIGVLWGDGLTDDECLAIYKGLYELGWNVESCAIGQGGGLLVKDANRDTERFAIKPSSQKRGEIWVDVQKDPLDASKKSKAGQLKLVKMQKQFDDPEDFEYKTINQSYPLYHDMRNEMVEVFRNGELLVDEGFDKIRERAA